MDSLPVLRKAQTPNLRDECQIPLLITSDTTYFYVWFTEQANRAGWSMFN